MSVSEIRSMPDNIPRNTSMWRPVLLRTLEQTLELSERGQNLLVVRDALAVIEVRLAS